MPWITPTLKSLREQTRDYIVVQLKGAALLMNSVTRAIADAAAGLAHLCLRFIAWLAKQLLPDTAETEWLDRHGDIWLVNADGSKGRKAAALSVGSATFTGTAGAVIPANVQLQTVTAEGVVAFETTAPISLGTIPTAGPIRSLTSGDQGNLEPGSNLTFIGEIDDIDNDAIVVDLTGGADEESDDDLRDRVLRRIRQPPMGGAAYDYEAWALEVPGVTRAWNTPLEMGMGTTTTRFMMDELRASNDGFPLAEDIQAVYDHIDQKRPVATKDFFVVGPIPQPLTVTITFLSKSDASTKASIEQAIKDMLLVKAKPGQTIYRSWIDEAVSGALGEDYHELTFVTEAMLSPGHMATLGTIIYAF